MAILNDIAKMHDEATEFDELDAELETGSAIGSRTWADELRREADDMVAGGRDDDGMDTTAATLEQPALKLDQVPRYFGGEGCWADNAFDSALQALIALTNRPEDDAALRFILLRLEDAQGDLVQMACEFGRVIEGTEVGEYGNGLNMWPDAAYMALTGDTKPYSADREA